MTPDTMKRNAGYAAAELVEDGMLIGIGTGSTVRFFIDYLIKRCQKGLKIQAVCSSVASYQQAQKGNLSLLEDKNITAIDITFDGADEIDPQKRMIKGGGGALTREKILANTSRELVVMIDESKKVEALGSRKLPVEILPFGYAATVSKIKTLGFRGELRTQASNTPFCTDNGNFIYDIEFHTLRETPEKDHERLIHIPGIVETGYFFNLAGRIFIGKSTGDVELWN
ncbi:MAG: ribose 5-phosphate isomerase A [Chlamydiota bacterium]